MADEEDLLHKDAVEGGNYDVIRDRLEAAGKRLREAAGSLDERRRDTFGSIGMEVLGTARVRTENNCVPHDIVQVSGSLLFGYNVHLGLKRQITPEDVFSLQSMEHGDEGYAFHSVTDESRLAFLNDRSFRREFEELYQYYKDASFLQLMVTETKLLAVFQTGATARDRKVLRWGLDPSGRITYIDNRGERDHVYPPTHDFTWTETSRSDHVLGRHPHVNILDTVFVETVGGDLTIKVDDNTTTGEGIYAEPVLDRDQSLDDAEISYAQRGLLILLRVKPFREPAYRYLVYNTSTRKVVRIDAIGQSCVALPEDHGILFPGGYYLRTGEHKIFDDSLHDMEFVRSIHSPNGEDVLYVFHRRSDGLYVLYPYNLINKEIATPISCHGWSLSGDGTLVVFRAAGEPTRVHPMQIWRTPFQSAEAYEQAPTDGSLLSRIGNRDLVRGISDALTICRLVADQQPTREMYEELVQACNRFVDAYYWVGQQEVGDLRSLVEGVRGTAELIVDEFVKVQTLRARATQVLREARAKHDALIADVQPDYFKEVEAFLDAMTRLRAHRGWLITLKETRYVDVEALDALEQAAIERFDQVSLKTVDFLLGDAAFAPLMARLDALATDIEGVTKAAELKELTERLDSITEGINLLSEVVAGLDVEDPTQKTTILEGIGEVVGSSNRVRAILDGRRRSLRSAEGKAEFLAQLKLFSQSVSSALALCNTPEACDEQLSRMLLQLEELEARFAELDEFLPQLADKRDEVYEAFTARKQTLLDERQRRVGSLVAAADRVLDGIKRRAGTFKEESELNAWFAADPMALKLRQQAEQLAGLGDTVKADELLSRLKSTRQDALRALRDKLDLFEEGDLIRLGKHRFSVNTQDLELTLVPVGDGQLAIRLNGTDYTAPITDESFLATRPYWDQTVVSEDKTVYRAEYLAASMLWDADAGRNGLTTAELKRVAPSREELLERVRAYASDRYEEGYERGIHDHDAAEILRALLSLRTSAGLLRFPSQARALAVLAWMFTPDRPTEAWATRARLLGKLRDLLGPSADQQRMVDELSKLVVDFHATSGLDPDGRAPELGRLAGEYLFEELQRDPIRVTLSPAAADLRAAFDRWLADHGGRDLLEGTLTPLKGRPAERLAVLRAWVGTYARHHDADADVADEVAALWLVDGRVPIEPAGGSAHTTVQGLRGHHPRVTDGNLELDLDGFLLRLPHFRDTRVPGFRAYRQARTELLERERKRLRVDEYKPKVMTAFVRNQLIDTVYLHLIGDNLAKQLGAAGEGKRTDLMGLLLLISPPGYGKTTLMEYVSRQLGLTFVKVNGPALGHEVTSLDPAEAGNATARQEVEKVNLGLEMGNNVMLYLDDIQHCHPEFLQKFISLCDAQRRIEGVWEGRTRTYDMRGKKFCVVMAGNPYTESGDKFQIPDMLANRADTYNLGDILGGREEVFALSFIENALTSNPALSVLASRPLSDLYALVRRARGEEIATTELSADYSAVELSEIEAVLKHLFACQQVLLKVNAEYIRSAAMEDAYRTEPRFQLQGSYRNMNKLAEKVVPVMNAAEVQSLISDHYRGEAQTLTTGAEANLLKLAELRGTMTEDEKARWAQIKEEFQRQQMMGGSDDPASKISGVLSGMVKEIGQLGARLEASSAKEVPAALSRVEGSLGALTEAVSAQKVDLRPVQAALAASVIDIGPVVDGLSGLSDRLGALGSRRAEVDLEPVLAELRALRSSLQNLPAAAPVVAPMPVDLGGASMLADARRELLSRARQALETGEAAEPGAAGTLAAAVSVIERLTLHMARAASTRLEPDQHQAFVDDLRRSVADAVNELAGG